MLSVAQSSTELIVLCEVASDGQQAASQLLRHHTLTLAPALVSMVSKVLEVSQMLHDGS